MTHTYTDTRFAARLKKHRRTRIRMARGYESKIGRDGLIVFRPKRRKRPFPTRGLMLLVVGVLCFKGLIMAQYGSDIYNTRVADLRNGTTVEQVGAAIMQTDPVSRFIAEKTAPIFR